MEIELTSPKVCLSDTYIFFILKKSSITSQLRTPLPDFTK